VVIAGIWYTTWLLLATGVDSPFLGTFGLVNLFANIALWVTPAVWAIGLLHTGAAWQGMSRYQAFATKFGVVSLLGSVLAWIGDDRLGMIDSMWADLWGNVALAGVLLNGLGWLTLGAVLVVGRPGPKTA
jgi:hypothetical protein